MSIRKPGLAPAAAVLLAASVASGHAVINEQEAPAGDFSFVTVRITHACGTSPTKAVRVQVPEGVSRVSPRFMPGWQVERKLRKLDKPFKNELGQLVTETVAELVWSGGPPLPDGYYEEFQIRAMMPNEPGRTLYFKTIQTCEQGEIRWIEVPQGSESPFSLKEPSPFVKLVPGKKKTE